MTENCRGWDGQKWIWLVMWLDFKIDCIWRMNRWIKLIFLHVETDSQKFKADQKFIRWALSKMDVATLKLAVSSMLVFCMKTPIQIQESYKLIQWFLGRFSQRCLWSFSSRDSKFEYANWADYFNANSDAIASG